MGRIVSGLELTKIKCKNYSSHFQENTHCTGRGDFAIKASDLPTRVRRLSQVQYNNISSQS